MDMYYFGCWNEAGHYLYAPNGKYIGRGDRIVWYGSGLNRRHIDGTLAPCRYRRTGKVVWRGMFERNEYDAEEMPQGHFLRHELDNGFSAIQWWDRTQGDGRPACNSTILMAGKHTTEELLTALSRNFPTVLANLTKAGVSLVEVFP